MLIRDFAFDVSGSLRAIVQRGEPVTVRRYRRDYVAVLPADLHRELVAAAGKRGEAILERYRQQAEQSEREVSAAAS